MVGFPYYRKFISWNKTDIPDDYFHSRSLMTLTYTNEPSLERDYIVEVEVVYDRDRRVDMAVIDYIYYEFYDVCPLHSRDSGDDW